MKKTSWVTKDIEEFGNALLKLRNKDEVIRFLSDLMTVPEIKIFAKRFLVAQMLEQSIPYVEIERSTGMSSATIAKISRSLKYGLDGYVTVINRMKRRH